MGKVVFSVKVKEGSYEISAESSYDDVHSVEDLRAFAMAACMSFEGIRTSQIGQRISDLFIKDEASGVWQDGHNGV